MKEGNLEALSKALAQPYRTYNEAPALRVVSVPSGSVSDVMVFSKFR
jgi:hypothetical protein